MCRTVAFALAALVLSSGSPARADEAEDKAVAFVEKLGGKVFRDEKAAGRPVVMVLLANTKVTNAGLKELAMLKKLASLNLAKTQVTDAGLKELTALKNLTVLYLGGTKVTDTGAQELLKALPKCDIYK
jgi:hypothetical protein